MHVGTSGWLLEFWSNGRPSGLYGERREVTNATGDIEMNHEAPDGDSRRRENDSPAPNPSPRCDPVPREGRVQALRRFVIRQDSGDCRTTDAPNSIRTHGDDSPLAALGHAPAGGLDRHRQRMIDRLLDEIRALERRLRGRLAAAPPCPCRSKGASSALGPPASPARPPGALAALLCGRGDAGPSKLGCSLRPELHLRGLLDGAHARLSRHLRAARAR